MNKNDLVSTNNELFRRNEELLATISDLKTVILELNNKIEVLTAEKSMLESQLNDTKTLQSSDKKAIEKVEFSQETEYGAKVIGRIVVNAAKYCNSLTQSVGNNITKEQINLILGRTEVAKSEILKTISLDCSFEEKKNIIEKSEQDVYDYFKSIMAQTE